MKETNFFKQLTLEFGKIIDHSGIDLNKRLILGLSGGPDSVLLFRLLHSLLPEGLECAHFNYQQRGADSQKEEDFCRALCSEYKVNFHVRRWDQLDHQQQKGNFQAAAREARYEWFDELLQHPKNGYILTAHHLDDQLEGFILALGRGAGLRGLKGMRLLSGNRFRPLIDWPKEKILAGLESISQEYRIDQSNLKNSYRRNAIRHQLIPILKDIFPDILPNFRRTTHILEDHWAYWTEELENSTLEDFESPLSTKDVLMLRYALTEKEFSHTQADDVLKALDKSERSVFQSPLCSITVSRGKIYLQNTAHPQINVSFALKTGRIGLSSRGFIEISKDVLSDLDFHSGLLCLPVSWKDRRLSVKAASLSDRMQPFGMAGKTKKVKNIVTDMKLTPPEKDNLLGLFTSENDLLWLIPYKTSELTRLPVDAEECFVLRYKTQS